MWKFLMFYLTFYVKTTAPCLIYYKHCWAFKRQFTYWIPKRSETKKYDSVLFRLILRGEDNRYLKNWKTSIPPWLEQQARIITCVFYEDQIEPTNLPQKRWRAEYKLHWKVSVRFLPRISLLCQLGSITCRRELERETLVTPAGDCADKPDARQKH